jgi:hypothetical protein
VPSALPANAAGHPLHNRVRADRFAGKLKVYHNNMRMTLGIVLLLLCTSLFGQPQPRPQHDYPLTLSVTRAKRLNHNGYVTTEAIGSLSDDPQHKQLHMTCDVGVFSIGPDGKVGNEYPARHGNKSNEIKIATREQGSDKTHEHTCKY